MTQKKTARKDEMDIIWMQKKIRKISQESMQECAVGAHSSGSSAGEGAGAGGDAAQARRCAVCGGVGAGAALHCAGDNAADLALANCFHVKVPASSLLCEGCARLAAAADRLRELVHLAFERIDKHVSPTRTIKRFQHEDDSTHTITCAPRETTDLLDAAADTPRPPHPPRARRPAPANANPHGLKRKVHVCCRICQQRYPTIQASDEYIDFVCSRCKKNEKKCIKGTRSKKNTRTPSLQVPPSKRRSRMLLLKKTHQLVVSPVGAGARGPGPVPVPAPARVAHAVSRFQCALCPRRYTLADHLAAHARAAHPAPAPAAAPAPAPAARPHHLDCARMATRESMAAHVKQHRASAGASAGACAGVSAGASAGAAVRFECGVCGAARTTKRALQAHAAAHEAAPALS